MNPTRARFPFARTLLFLLLVPLFSACCFHGPYGGWGHGGGHHGGGHYRHCR